MLLSRVPVSQWPLARMVANTEGSGCGGWLLYPCERRSAFGVVSLRRTDPPERGGETMNGLKSCDCDVGTTPSSESTVVEGCRDGSKSEGLFSTRLW